MSSRQQATLRLLPVTPRIIENGPASERFSLFGRALGSRRQVLAKRYCLRRWIAVQSFIDILIIDHLYA
jgi:hypothetical protein